MSQCKTKVNLEYTVRVLGDLKIRKLYESLLAKKSRRDSNRKCEAKIVLRAATVPNLQLKRTPQIVYSVRHLVPMTEPTLRRCF